MRTAPMPNVLLAGDAQAQTGEARAALEGAGFPVTHVPLRAVDPTSVGRYQLVILGVEPEAAAAAQGLCRRWRIELGEQYVPILWLCPESEPGLAAAALDAGADICLRVPFAPEQFLAQCRALLRVQHLYGRLAARAADAQQINHRLQQAYQQIDNDLELTRRIHRGFLPRALPEVLGARFAVCYRPRSRVGGDFYDVIRLDEEHVAMYAADAMGRGVPASSLLTIFVKKTLQPKEIIGRSYRLIPPDEVLERLNRELVALGMPEPPFVTMMYMQLNCRDGSLAFARAAHPHPLYVPADGDPEYWHAPGTLLGVFEADYPLQTKQLRPGDKVVLYTDGVFPPGEGGPGGSHDRLLESARRHRDLPLQPFVDQLARDILEQSTHPDDLTLLGVEYR